MRNVAPVWVWVSVIFAQAQLFVLYVMAITMMFRLITAILQANIRSVEVRAHALNVKEKDITDYGKSTIVYRYHRAAPYRRHGSVALRRKEAARNDARFGTGRPGV